ncbi:MAG: hypothetical protein CXZ00_00795 [Acidobacteria bacterium]|nr:MAG: hypothetical protein CXZ00_00795 [Acidobacteriota bacterium]
MPEPTSGEEAPRIEIHDLPAFLAGLKLETQLTVMPGETASAAWFAFQLELGKNEAAVIFRGSLNDPKVDANVLILGEIGLDLILKI